MLPSPHWLGAVMLSLLWTCAQTQAQYSGYPQKPGGYGQGNVKPGSPFAQPKDRDDDKHDWSGYAQHADKLIPHGSGGGNTEPPSKVSRPYYYTETPHGVPPVGYVNPNRLPPTQFKPVSNFKSPSIPASTASTATKSGSKGVALAVGGAAAAAAGAGALARRGKGEKPSG